MRQKKLILSCLQICDSLKFLSKIIPRFPENVDEICIDFDASKFIQPQFASYERHWDKLDIVLMERHRLGMLKHLCFRSTRRDDTFSTRGSLSYTTGAVDRTILGRIESLLPRSVAEPQSFMEIDSDTLFFEPGF